MNYDYCVCQEDKGPEPFTVNIEQTAGKNRNFRTAVWTGDNLQMTVMCIPSGEEIGIEIHTDTDQFIRVEQGIAMVKQGKCKEHPDFQKKMSRGDAVFIPAGRWHNVSNIGRCSLKLSSIYAPPKHPRGTVHPMKADAEMYEW